MVHDYEEKTLGLNGLMKKYQPEGNYTPLQKDDLVLDEVAVIKIIPESIRGKYKIGQQIRSDSRMALAKKILKRNSPSSVETIKTMGFEITENDELKMVDEPNW